MTETLSNTKRILSRWVYGNGSMRAFLSRQRSFAIVMVVSLIAVTWAGIIAVRGLARADESGKNAASRQEKSAEGSSMTTTFTNDKVSPIAGDSAMNSFDSKVYVNGQQIEVPKNGSVSQTITSDNGTTRLEATQNSSSSGDGAGGVTTTTLNVSSSSNDVKVRSP